MWFAGVGNGDLLWTLAHKMTERTGKSLQTAFNGSESQLGSSYWYASCFQKRRHCVKSRWASTMVFDSFCISKFDWWRFGMGRRAAHHAPSNRRESGLNGEMRQLLAWVLFTNRRNSITISGPRGKSHSGRACFSTEKHENRIVVEQFAIVLASGLPYSQTDHIRVLTHANYVTIWDTIIERPDSPCGSPGIPTSK